MAIEVTCPACGRQYNVKDEAAGKKFKCKDCGEAVSVPAGAGGSAAADDFGDPYNPYAEEDFGAGEAPPIASRRPGKKSRSSSAAAQRTNLPAIFLYVVCGLSIAYITLNLITTAMGFQAQFPGMNQPPPEIMNVSKAIAYVIMVIFILRDCFIIYAARQLQSLQSYGIAMTGAILAVIPCIGSPCCLLGVPFGIWALVVLSDAEVKGAFR